MNANAATPSFVNLLRAEYKSMEFADCELRVGDQSFKAHRLVLCLHSHVFKANFEHDADVKKTGIIKLSDTQRPELITKMLEFFYTEQEELLSGSEIEMFTLADYFNAEILKEKCLIYMCQHLKLSNCMLYMRLAYDHNLDKMKTKIAEFLSETIESADELKGFDKLEPAIANDMLKRMFKCANRSGKIKELCLTVEPSRRFHPFHRKKYQFRIENTGQARLAFHVVDQPGRIHFKRPYGFLKRNESARLSPWFVSKDSAPNQIEVKYARASEESMSLLKLQDPYIQWKTKVHELKEEEEVREPERYITDTDSNDAFNYEEDEDEY